MDYNFITFQKQAIKRFLALDKYKYIRDNLYKCNVSTNKEFQTVFDSFFRVRRDKTWRNIFFTYFQEAKNIDNIRFEDILKYIYENTKDHCIEPSFSSKMLSTINPNMPIWDQFVLENLELKVDGKTKEERLQNTIDTYYKIVKKENEMLEEKEIQESIQLFRNYFKEYDLSDIKILDYLIWNTRKEDSKL